MSNPINVLSTKTLSKTQKEVLENNNFNVFEVDFIKTATTNFDLKDINENLIFTSQNAVHSVLANPNCESLKTKNTFCVGLKTKILLSENGFNVDVYTGYAEDLAEIITLIHSSESFTFFSGNLRRETLPKALTDAKIKFNEINVYTTTLTPQKFTTAVEAIMFFSPSGVESYLKDNLIKKETCFCIGETTASALHKITKNVVVASNQTIEDVIEDCINEYN